MLVVACFWLSACGNENSRESSGTEAIDAFADRLQFAADRDSIGSLSAVIFQKDELIWSDAFGFADRENLRLADTNTIYRAASITKSITAFLMMLMVQDGTISLDEPVSNYLPQVHDLQRTNGMDSILISFKHLANHTSGLDREPEWSEAAVGPFSEWESKVTEAIPLTKMRALPGAKYYYSNIGYAILGLALAKAADKSYVQLVEERVFQPLKMERSFFHLDSNQGENLAAGYRWHPFKGIIDSKKSLLEHEGRGYKVPNGGLYTTPADLSRFLRAQLGYPDLLNKELRPEMMRIQTADSDRYGYGLGFYIRKDDKGIEMVEHDGGVAGYQAMMVFNPKSEIGVVLMRNYDFGLTNMLLEPRTVLRELVESQERE